MSVDQRGNVAQKPLSRPACYLCETPKTPWAVIDSLPNLPENNVVCRSCVNFEGVDRIGDVILETVRQKREYAVQMGANGHNNTRNPSSSRGEPSGRERLMIQQNQRQQDRSRQEQMPDPIRTDHRLPQPRHEQPRIQHTIQRTIPGAIQNIPNAGNPSINAFTQNPVLGPRGAVGIGTLTQNPTITGLNGPTLLPNHPSLITTHPIKHNPITTMSQDQIRRIPPAVGPNPRIQPTVSDHSPCLRPGPQLTITQPQLPTLPQPVSPHIKPEMEKQTIIRKTLAKLNECVPFRVRFKKEPSVRGRVYGFDYTHSRPNPELKVYIEYPIGSGSIHKSASAAAHKMSLDASGGSMDKMTSISSGFKFLEYEIKYRSEDWRLLGDFLTEPVRYFKELMSQELVPTGYIDPNVSSPPKIPSGGSNSDSQDEEISIVDEIPRRQNDKRSDKPSTSDGEPPSKWSRKNEPESGRHSTSPKGPPTPVSAKTNSPSRDPVNSPDAAGPGSNGQQSLLCFLCRHRLEASHFVQCPSQQLHRFCFPCCQQTIQRALQENPNSEVFCPAGQRCAISGSQNPWAFMQAEIETILDRAGHVNNNARPTQG